jgi:hypothetical protein
LTELEDYLTVLIVQKLEAALADQDLEITQDELAQVVSLAIEYTLSSRSTRLHRLEG